MNGLRHDWTLYSRSKLKKEICHALLHEEGLYCIASTRTALTIHGSIWRCHYSALIGMQNKIQFNTSMEVARITVEWVFKEVNVTWSTTDYRRKMRVLQAPIGSLYLAAMLLTNIRTCLYGNQVFRYFFCTHSSLKAYMNSRE